MPKLPGICTVFVCLVSLISLSPHTVFAGDFDITISPGLDISRFAPYHIYVDSIPYPENVTSATLTLRGVNGNDGNTECWDYYLDGTCASEAIDLMLTFNEGLNRWESPNIYPDYIYPEVYFASSPVTWYNTPLQTPLFRETYAVFRYENPFVMVSDMSFWIEFNAIPNAANSSDLEIYLVENSAEISLFQSDWRHSPLVELVGTFDSSAVFNHTHTLNSSHHLVTLRTNLNGTVGNGSIDVSDHFWIILYSKSPNVARSWKLRYHPLSICDHDQRWYTGNQFGWLINETSGCPDAHIHIARRSAHMDGVHALVTARYANETSDTDEEAFYFGTLPNLAPNGTAFISPYLGGAYAGTMNIEWIPANDANNNNLNYTIDLLNQDGSFNRNIVTDTSNTTTTFNTIGISDGPYLLKGTVCDDGTPELCTEFETDTLFHINNGSNIASLPEISIDSTNENSLFAKAGEHVSVTFTSDGVKYPFF